jgi:hypothetical protein
VSVNPDAIYMNILDKFGNNFILLSACTISNMEKLILVSTGSPHLLLHMRFNIKVKNVKIG